jgi:hypothetical protein
MLCAQIESKNSKYQSFKSCLQEQRNKQHTWVFIYKILCSLLIQFHLPNKRTRIYNYFPGCLYEPKTETSAWDTNVTSNKQHCLTSGENGSYWFSFSGSLTAWLYTCCRMCRSSPRDGCLFSLWAGSEVPFSYNKVNVIVMELALTFVFSG